jgi:hypothetical protein
MSSRSSPARRAANIWSAGMSCRFPPNAPQPQKPECITTRTPSPCRCWLTTRAAENVVTAVARTRLISSRE